MQILTNSHDSKLLRKKQVRLLPLANANDYYYHTVCLLLLNVIHWAIAVKSFVETQFSQ